MASRSSVPAMLLLWITLLVASASAAEPSREHEPTSMKVTVSLVAASAERASHACVVSYNQLGKDSVSLDKIDHRAADEYTIDDLVLSGQLALGTAVSRDLTSRVQSCVTDSGVCLPSFRIVYERRHESQAASPQRIQCTPNKRLTSVDDFRVVVLFVDANMDRFADEPIVRDAQFDGSTVTFNLGNFPRDRAKVLVHVLGGHYTKTSSRLVQNDLVELPLVPRCRQHEIALPPSAREKSATVTLSTDQEKPTTCIATLDGQRRFKMSLPYLAPRTPKHVEVEVTNEGAPTLARYEGTWSELEPPAVLALRNTAVSFSWRRDCLYPIPRRGEITCPDATIVGAGLNCTGTHDQARSIEEHTEVCSYVCEAHIGRDADRPSVAFDLPAKVRLQRPGTDDVWVEELNYGNQLLTGFVDPGGRHLDVDLSLWGRRAEIKELTHRRGANIFWIAVRDPTGVEHYVAPTEGQRVSLPGVRCGDVLLYWPIGDRPYRSDFVSVQNGRLVFGRPERLERLTELDFSVGGGAEIPLQETVQRELGRKTRYRMPAQPYGYVRVALEARPPGWALVGSFRVTAQLGGRTYFPLRAPFDATELARQDIVAYSRWLFEPALLWVMNRAVHVGMTPGVMFSSPIRRQDFERAGDPQWAFVLGLLGRVRFTAHAALEAGITLPLPGNDAYAYSSTFFEDTQRIALSTRPFLFDLGLRWEP